ncbi:hypothetical protein ACTXT7_003503 [Hymenolepis weldensis]
MYPWLYIKISTTSLSNNVVETIKLFYTNGHEKRKILNFETSITDMLYALGAAFCKPLSSLSTSLPNIQTSR